MTEEAGEDDQVRYGLHASGYLKAVKSYAKMVENLLKCLPKD